MGVLVLDSYLDIMALYWWIDQELLLCPGLIAKDHGYEIGFQVRHFQIDK